MNDRLKLIAVNAAEGNQEIVNQQATTFTAFDTLEVIAGSDLTWFEGANTRTMPFTNLQENKLQVQQSIIVDRIALTQLDDEYGGVNSYQAIPQGLFGDFSVEVGNQRVIKNTPLQFFNQRNSIAALVGDQQFNGILNLMNPFVIPPQTNFKLTIRSANGSFESQNENSFIRVAFIGFGAQYKPEVAY